MSTRAEFANDSPSTRAAKIGDMQDKPEMIQSVIEVGPTSEKIKEALTIAR